MLVFPFFFSSLQIRTRFQTFDFKVFEFDVRGLVKAHTKNSVVDEICAAAGVDSRTRKSCTWKQRVRHGLRTISDFFLVRDRVFAVGVWRICVKENVPAQ